MKLSTQNIRRIAWAAFVGSSLLCVTPVNSQEITSTDDFIEQITLEGNSIHAKGTTQGATRESNEDYQVGGSFHTVWWSWKAPASGIAQIDTLGSGLDTQLTVYLGNEVSNLKWVAYNDNTEEPLSKQSVVRFPVTKNSIYRIQVNDKGTSGEFILNISLEPSPLINMLSFGESAVVSNDDFRFARELKGGRQGAAMAYNLSVRGDGSESAYASVGGKGLGMWWHWTPDSIDEVVISTAGSDFDTALGVFTGTDVTNLKRIAVNGDANSNEKTSVVRFRPVVGQEYKIFVDRQAGEQEAGRRGSIILNLQQQVVLGVGLPQIRLAVEVELNSLQGVTYQLERSTDMLTWTKEGEPFQGTGELMGRLVSTHGRLQEYFQFVTP